ncbi:MAG TPA: diadenylate cyclase CdaA [Chloroflexota bacterium]|nr:diadenylate cyclase CdaA [Chloroflexota bacterium]
MTEVAQQAVSTLDRLTIWSALDVLTVAIIIYGVLSLFRGTSAFSALYGIGLLLIAVAVVNSLPRLVMLNWLLRNLLPFLSFGLLVVFQPELRRAMERIGRVRGLLRRPLTARDQEGIERAITEIARACRRLSERRYGALIVIERDTGLHEYSDSGVQIDAIVTTELLLTLFFPNSPLHDAAVIIHGDRVVAAGCVMPLSESPLDSSMGTRHRAGLGITELTDALSIVVSEETGIISLMNNGRMVRHLDEGKLRKVLTVLLSPQASYAPWRWRGRGGTSASTVTP